MYVAFQGLEVCLKLRSCVAGESGVGCVACGEVVADDNKLVAAPAVGLVVGCADVDLTTLRDYAIARRLAEVFFITPIGIVAERFGHKFNAAYLVLLPKGVETRA